MSLGGIPVTRTVAPAYGGVYGGGYGGGYGGFGAVAPTAGFGFGGLQPGLGGFGGLQGGLGGFGGLPFMGGLGGFGGLGYGGLNGGLAGYGGYGGIAQPVQAVAAPVVAG